MCRGRVASVNALGGWCVIAIAAAACSGQRGTIGARLGQDPSGHVTIREVPSGLGCAKAGLLPGDELLLVDGEDVRNFSSQQLHQKLAGERGTHLRLTVLRGDSVLRVNVERTEPKRGK